MEMATRKTPPSSSVRRKSAPRPSKSITPATKRRTTNPERTPESIEAAKKPVVSRPKEKMVRDSFTIPKSEYASLGNLKQRATGLAHPVKKSELLRAGINCLTAMSDKAFLAAVQAVPSVKTGRPKADAASDEKIA